MGRSGRGLRVRGARLTGVVLVGALLGGCYWHQPGAGPGHARSNPDEKTLKASNVASLTEKWSVEVEGTLSEPVTDGDRAFSKRQVDGTFASVQAFDLRTGETAWEHALPMPGFGVGDLAVPVAFSGDELRMGHIARFPFQDPPCGDQTRLDPDTGAVLGIEHVAFQTSATVTSGSITAHMESSRCTDRPVAWLRVRDRATGAILWTGGGTAGEVMAPPTIAGGMIYLNDNGAIHAYDADGCGSTVCSQLWISPVAITPNVPVVAAGGLIFGSFNHFVNLPPPQQSFSVGELYAISATTGQEVWRAVYTGSEPPPLFNGATVVAFAATDDTVFVVGSRDSATGEPIGTLDAYPLAGCGAAVCTPEWSSELDPAGATLAIGGDVVYVTSGDRLLAYPADGCDSPTCATIGKVELAGPAREMSVSAGKVLVVTEAAGTSTLTSYGLPPGS